MLSLIFLSADGLEAFRNSHTAKPVALCLVVRDEDVREWVQHHRSIGEHPLHCVEVTVMAGGIMHWYPLY